MERSLGAVHTYAAYPFLGDFMIMRKMRVEWDWDWEPLRSGLHSSYLHIQKTAVSVFAPIP